MPNAALTAKLAVQEAWVRRMRRGWPVEPEVRVSKTGWVWGSGDG